MRRLLTFAALAIAVWAASIAPAGAITGNYQRDFIHDYVGLVVFYDGAGEFSHRCSGSLLTPRVFLTAGHCTEGVDSGRVYMQQDAGAHFDPELGFDPISGYPLTGGVTSHEMYNFGFHDFAGFPNTHDAGLVILDEPVDLDGYAALAAVGSLDRLGPKRDVRFTISGYGLSRSSPVGTISFRERLMATSRLINLNSHNNDGFNVQTTANPGNGQGGTCSGDSGGPVLFGTSDTIVAVTSFGLNPFCRGVDFGYRTDRRAVINWILSHSPARERDDIAIVPL